MVRVAVPRETQPGERRVALVPETVRALGRSGVEVTVERGAGEAARLSDAAYEAVGATLADAADVCRDADVVVRVQRPDPEDADRVPDGAVLVALFRAASGDEMVAQLAGRGVRCLALEKVPRTTRAQAMDVLSSQATVAGYKAVLLGAAALDKFLPMLTTAAGSIAPARCLVIGAGVAGLQAIATARRLGAIVSGFDIRPAAAEQVESLGASFIAPGALDEGAEAQGGYAREQSRDEQQRTLDTLAHHLPQQDLVITTAQIPGRPAPRLVTEAMVASMRPGSVIVDLAAESGGNCELTRPDEAGEAHGVTLLGPTDLPASVPLHASQMFSRNLLALLQHLVKDGALALDPETDEIARAMLLADPGVPTGR